jgi:colanic acid/amylovoran biosynthesis glycosyltransferase
MATTLSSLRKHTSNGLEIVKSEVKVAYLVGAYPAVSHTFVLREVLALRAAGVEVRTISIHRAERENLLSAADRAEYETTYSVLPAKVGALARAHLAALASPSAYFRTLRRALGFGRKDPKGRLWQFFYFVEGILVWNRCRRWGVRHLHAQMLNQASDASLLAVEYGRARDGEGAWTWSFTMHGPNEFFDVSRFAVAEKAAAADAVVCISDFARSQLMGFTAEDRWDRFEVVHCGLDPTEYDPVAVAAPRATDGEFRILCVGRLVSFKGQGMLLDALVELARRGIRARLTLVGDGESRATLEAKAEALEVADRVEFAGAVGQDEIRRYYADADAFCLPSFAEGVPVVLMEAMAMELPVVTSRIMGITELIDDGIDGLLTRPGRTDQLVEALARLATDRELRRRLGAEGRAKVVAEFDVRESGRRLAALFARVGG